MSDKEALQRATRRLEHGIGLLRGGDLVAGLIEIEKALALYPDRQRGAAFASWVRGAEEQAQAEGDLDHPNAPTTTVTRPPLLSERSGEGEWGWDPVPLAPPTEGGQRGRGRTTVGPAPSGLTGAATITRIPTVPRGALEAKGAASRSSTGIGMPRPEVPELTAELVAGLAAQRSGLGKVAPAEGDYDDSSDGAEEGAKATTVPPDTQAHAVVAPPAAAGGSADEENPYDDLTLVPASSHFDAQVDSDDVSHSRTNPFIRNSSLTQKLAHDVGGAADAEEPPLPGARAPGANRATEALARGDLASAFDACEAVLAVGGGLQGPWAELQRPLIERIYGGLVGGPHRVPMALATTPNLDSRSAFILSRLDGTMTVEDVIDVSGMPRLETMRLLALLVRSGAVAMK